MSTPISVYQRLKIGSEQLNPGARGEGVKLFSVLLGDRYDGVYVRNDEFSPQLLLRLVRLAYQHVRPSEDAKHAGAYTPDMRDHAERARNAIVSALLNAKGEEGWTAKLEMANDPLCAHFKDRILAVADEEWAEEIDSVALKETQAVTLDNTGEAPPSTNEGMFALMNDRLADLADLMATDYSPREAWAGIKEEKVMRREIARELRHTANGLYKVDQEAVTGDEKETDIRMQSVVTEHEGVIELKLADNRSAVELRGAIEDQLVKKYMAPENRRSGCLLVTLARDRMWRHPDNGSLIGVGELESVLCKEAMQVEGKMKGMVALSVQLLDLRPRLSPKKR